MPKKQTRAQNLARQIQAATRLPYTQCLKLCEPSEDSWTRLARALRAAGLAAAADHLLAVNAAATEAGTWYYAMGEVQDAFYLRDYDWCEKAASACSRAAEAALNRAGFETQSYDTDAEAYHSAFLALSQAGTLPDARELARAALDVFADDPTWCSDVIRSQGRDPFTYESAARLTGPDTPTAVAARKAAGAMARAAAVRTGSDELWYEAAGIMVEVIWHASVAAGLPPLVGRRDCQDHLAHFMGGVIPNR
ncbi:hypothetical protein [Streptomyces sp. NPDC085466]|uniref:hypothetical protein n=1 Tax=Streptomyces sp. NPDC085466 TaxID=3365725 RepID=UPI0037CE8526